MSKPNLWNMSFRPNFNPIKIIQTQDFNVIQIVVERSPSVNEQNVKRRNIVHGVLHSPNRFSAEYSGFDPCEWILSKL